MKIVLIGAGNVAYHLGSLLQSNGHDIIQIYNRTVTHGSKLAIELQSDFTTKVQDIDKNADLYIIALKDDVIESFCKKITFNPRLIVHTSGTCSIDVFPSTFNCGVLYPVQTFSKSIAETPEEIPFCIEARKGTSLGILRTLVKSMNKTAVVKSSAEREKIHLAAVIVNNFTNHLFTLSSDFLKNEGLSFDILRPLIMETAVKIQSGLPSHMQTGPARRADQNVIKEHVRLLKKHPELKSIYDQLTKSIIKYYSK